MLNAAKALAHIDQLLRLTAVACMLLIGSVAFGQGVELVGLDGENLSELELQQGSVVVIVWTTWNRSNRPVFDRINEIVEQWGDRARVIAVNLQEEWGTVEDSINNQTLLAPVYLDPDGAFCKKYAATRLPNLIVFRDGVLAFNGALPDDPNRLLREIL